MARTNTNKPGTGTRRRKSQKQIAFERKFKIRLGLLIVLTIFLSWVLIVVKTQVFKFLVERATYEANESSEPESRLYKAINYSFHIKNSDHKRAQLFELLSNPVAWYNRTRHLDQRFPSDAEYDIFRFLVQPNVEQIDFAGSNYEINFHGVYRYRNPGKTLLNFESGVGFIEGGLITSLATKTAPNEYHLDWINTFWRRYPYFCFGGVFIILLIILFGRLEKSLLFAMVKQWLGG